MVFQFFIRTITETFCVKRLLTFKRGLLALALHYFEREAENCRMTSLVDNLNFLAGCRHEMGCS